MKNLLVLGLVAALLFSISAALSLYLQQSGKPAETADTAKTEKPAKEKEPEAKAEKNAPKLKAEDQIPSGSAREQNAALQDQLDRIERQKSRLVVVTADLRNHRDRVEQQTKELTLEIRKSMAFIGELDGRAKELIQVEQANSKSADELKKQQLDIEESERKNIEKLATVLDTASSETAASIITKMADEGKLDTAVKVLSRMKERAVAKVLEAMPDASLAAQILDRMRTLKRPASP